MNEEFPQDRMNDKPMKNAQLLRHQNCTSILHPAPVRMAVTKKMSRRGSPAFNPSTQEVESRQVYIPGPSTNAF